jgi:small multidrug resistance family-3 protein
VYAGYGAVYVAVALLWLRLVDGAAFSGRDLLGSVVILGGMGILMGKSHP